MQKAIYAFSGDPITYGHIDIIERASKVFDELVVAIGTNPDKNYTFPLDDRKDMAEKSLKKYENVRVVSFDGLLVDYAYENSIKVIVKGIRNENDYVYEQMLHQVGESQELGIETFLLPAKQDKMHISSSAVKSLQKEHGLVHDYVPLYVKQNLEAKLSNQFILGVTGEIAVGKSYMCKQFEKFGVENDIKVNVIELDEIGHRILGELTEPMYVEVRKSIIKEFGEEVRGENGFIDRTELGRIVFNDSKRLEKLNKIMHKAILLRLRKEIYNIEGLILISAALFVEINIMYLCNNNILLISTSDELQRKRMIERGYDEKQVERRITSQFSTDKKREMIKEEIEKSKQGNLWEVENSNSEKLNLKELFTKVISSLHIS